MVAAGAGAEPCNCSLQRRCGGLGPGCCRVGAVAVECLVPALVRGFAACGVTWNMLCVVLCYDCCLLLCDTLLCLQLCAVMLKLQISDVETADIRC